MLCYKYNAFHHLGSLRQAVHFVYSLQVPFSGGGGGGSGGILPAANNGQRYEHYHAILDHMQQQKENIKVLEEKGLKWNMETPPRERVHGYFSIFTEERSPLEA